jgi:DNA-binding protein YbaB
MSEITGRASAAGVTVEVHPGGAMSSLSLDGRALAQGPDRLAAAIVAAVAEATAVANQRTKNALRGALGDLGEAELAVLGLHQEADLTERAEATTPQSWKAAP